MRTVLAYTSARILMLVVAFVVLYLCGARGILLIGLAFVITAILSYVLLFKQREKMASGLNSRLSKATSKVTEFKERLEDGAAAEDTDLPSGMDEPEVSRPKGAESSKS